MKVDSCTAPAPSFPPIEVTIRLESYNEMKIISHALKAGRAEAERAGALAALALINTLLPHFTPL
jgi:hypothetical protein